MTIGGFVRYSAEQLRANGPLGVRSVVDEFVWGTRDRFRRLHWMTPRTRTLRVNGTTVRIHQTTVSEFDHIRALANERTTLAAVYDELESDDVFWDVGANVGAYACFAGKKGIETVAFEPFAENSRRLRENLALNDIESVVVKRLALADESGARSFTLDPRECSGSGRGSLRDDWKEGRRIRVDCTTGDDLVRNDDASRPDVVKIDVEGAELSVLRGFEGTFERGDVRSVFCELHGVDDAAVRRFLEEHGFVVEREPSDETGGVLYARRVPDASN